MIMIIQEEISVRDFFLLGGVYALMLCLMFTNQSYDHINLSEKDRNVDYPIFMRFNLCQALKTKFRRNLWVFDFILIVQRGIGDASDWIVFIGSSENYLKD